MGAMPPYMASGDDAQAIAKAIQLMVYKGEAPAMFSCLCIAIMRTSYGNRKWEGIGLQIVARVWIETPSVHFDALLESW